MIFYIVLGIIIIICLLFCVFIICKKRTTKYKGGGSTKPGPQDNVHTELYFTCNIHTKSPHVTQHFMKLGVSSSTPEIDNKKRYTKEWGEHSTKIKALFQTDTGDEDMIMYSGLKDKEDEKANVCHYYIHIKNKIYNELDKKLRLSAQYDGTDIFNIETEEDLPVLDYPDEQALNALFEYYFHLYILQIIIDNDLPINLLSDSNKAANTKKYRTSCSKDIQNIKNNISKSEYKKNILKYACDREVAIYASEEDEYYAGIFPGCFLIYGILVSEAEVSNQALEKTLSDLKQGSEFYNPGLYDDYTSYILKSDNTNTLSLQHINKIINRFIELVFEAFLNFVFHDTPIVYSENVIINLLDLLELQHGRIGAKGPFMIQLSTIMGKIDAAEYTADNYEISINGHVFGVEPNIDDHKTIVIDHTLTPEDMERKISAMMERLRLFSIDYSQYGERIEQCIAILNGQWDSSKTMINMVISCIEFLSTAPFIYSFIECIIYSHVKQNGAYTTILLECLAYIFHNSRTFMRLLKIQNVQEIMTLLHLSGVLSVVANVNTTVFIQEKLITFLLYMLPCDYFLIIEGELNEFHTKTIPILSYYSNLAKCTNLFAMYNTLLTEYFGPFYKLEPAPVLLHIERNEKMNALIEGVELVGVPALLKDEDGVELALVTTSGDRITKIQKQYTQDEILVLTIYKIEMFDKYGAIIDEMTDEDGRATSYDDFTQLYIEQFGSPPNDYVIKYVYNKLTDFMDD